MKLWLLLVLCASFVMEEVQSCTAFQLRARTGELFYCRSMEYGFQLDSNLLIVPRKTAFNSAVSNNQGIKWQTQYGYLGMNQSIDRTSISDGMNEKGLVVGCLYLPGFAKYQTLDQNVKSQALAPWELAGYLLGACATIKEVKYELARIIVTNISVPGFDNFFLPLHFYICDRSGSVLVVEYVNGERKEYDNPLGVLTNSPTFDWHLNNLTNYVNLSPVNITDMKLGNIKVKSIGQGSGLLGLPGDYTPPSRFIRAALFSNFAVKPKTNQDAIRIGFHILNSFDITEGFIQNRSTAPGALIKDKDGKEVVNIESTEWAIIHDRTQLKTYFRTYEGLSIQMVDLKKTDFTTPGLRQLLLDRTLVIEDATSKEIPLAPDEKPEAQ